ncbi:MAG: (2Fe-2S)-binding protein [Spirochaetes bacterium]|nr:(2Fe-2S)-binding protein [Spirochaetota bacterium]MBU1080594.1 (2Fe-2S)-binding protein [Spirochaetota bacterium]
MLKTSNRVADHAVLGAAPEAADVEIFLDGQPITAKEGEPVMSALVAAGVTVFRHTAKGSPRRMFCGIGRCTDCVMKVDGVPGVRTCVTRVAPGMRVERQDGKGNWSEGAEDGR